MSWGLTPVQLGLGSDPRAGNVGLSLAGQRLEIGDGLRRRERPFLDGDLERLFERHQQLDALERTQSKLIDRR